MKWQRYPAYKPSGVEWLGEVPEHWEIKRLKTLTTFVTSGSRGWAQHYSEEGALFIRIGNLSRTSIGLDLRDIQFVSPPGGAEVERTRVEKNDVLISITAYIGSIAVVGDDLGEAYVNQHIALTRPRTDLVDSKWVGYGLISSVGQAQFKTSLYGGTKEGLGLDNVKNLFLLMPTLAEQRAIAAFLDRETARIDALMEKKQRQIELLQEKRVALISHAVTKGLDSTAKMKDSGIKGLGGIPAHWQMKKLKFLTPQLTVGIVITPSKYYVDSGIPCLRSLNVREDRLTETDLVFISQESNELLHKSKLNLGDIVSVRTGQPGTTAVVNETFNGANCIDLIITRRSAKFDSRFMCYVLNSEFSKTQYLAGSSGAIQAHFNIETASNMLIAVPPLLEQVHIRDQLDVEIGKIIALIRKIELSICTLKEHRTALISAAVTGKIDVRSGVRKAPAAFQRIVLAAEIVDRLHNDPNFGRVKFQKVLYLCEHHLGMDLEGNYWRQAAGPLDNRMLYSVENQIQRQKWFATRRDGQKITYVRMEKAGGHRKYFDDYWADYREGLDSLLELMRPLNTERSEIVATLFAAWNDLILAGLPFADEDILHEVRSNWHESKERFDEDRLRRALQWMRDQGLVPRGLGRATRNNMHGNEGL